MAVHSGMVQKCQSTVCVPSITVTCWQDGESQKYIYSSAIDAQRKKHTKVIMFEQTLNVLTLWEHNEVMWLCPFYWIKWNTTSHHLQKCCQYYSKIYYSVSSRSKPATAGKAYKHVEHRRMLVTWDENLQTSWYTGKRCKYHWILQILPLWSQSKIHGWLRN